MALTSALDRIDALEQRVTELEERLAEVAQRQEDASYSMEWYRQCQKRLEMLPKLTPLPLKSVPLVPFGEEDTASREAWLERMKRRLASIAKTR